MSTYNNDQYYASLYWGSSSQEITTIFDSGSSKCWLPMDTCPSNECTQGNYAHGDSTSFVDGATEATLTYGSGSVTGTFDTDRVCLTSDTTKCSDDFKFLGVSTATGMSGLNAAGLCGMKPDLGESDTYQLVPKLKDSGAIDKAQFTMHLRDTGTDSWIEFGSTADDDKYTWTHLTANPTLWSTMLRETNTWATVSGAIWDSGTSNTYIPSADLNGVRDWLNIELSSDCAISNYVIECPCSSSTNLDSHFPDLEITTGSSSSPLKLVIKGSDYMYYSTSNSQCESYIMSNSDFANAGYWLLGLNFYRAFEISHDLENNKIGFYALGGSSVDLDSSEEGQAQINFGLGIMAILALGLVTF